MDSIAVATLIAYLILMIVVGLLFTKLNRSEDDFLRSGCRASWWMVGISTFMGSFSAWVFTGAAGAVYTGGWSVLWMFFSQILGFTIAALFLAPWFRQIRKMAFGEVVDARFGTGAAQFFTWVGIPTAPFGTAGALFGLGIFITALTGYDMRWVILSVGIVIIVYSFFGGTWANMATDFIQGIILIPFTIIIAVVCLIEMGGPLEIWHQIQAQGLQQEFKLINAPGVFEENRYTWGWAMATVLSILTGFISLGQAMRFRSVKTGADAKKAAAFCVFAFAIGSLIWFVPPLYARLNLTEMVAAMPLNHPEEGAFAATALALMPAALQGILMVAVLSAAMSSMDGALGAFSGAVVKVMYPGLCKLFKWREIKDGKKLLLMSRISLLVFGFLSVLLALYFEARKLSIFELMFDLIAFLVAMNIPFIWALFIKKVPSWSFYFTTVVGAVPVILGLFSQQLFGQSWNFQTQYLMNFGVGSLAFFSTRFFWKWSSESYRKRVDDFFITMKTPIDVEKEIGDVADTNALQLKLTGGCTLATGLFLSMLIFFGENLREYIIIGSLGMSVTTVGGLMYFYGNRAYKHYLASMPVSGMAADLDQSVKSQPAEKL
jgi:Na+/proline symporter